jgi:hypothetical protein
MFYVVAAFWKLSGLTDFPVGLTPSRRMTSSPKNYCNTFHLPFEIRVGRIVERHSRRPLRQASATELPSCPASRNITAIV